MSDVAEDQQLQGPDLKNDGLDNGDLASGAMTLGHVDGQQVLLARTSEGVRAVGASCAHYGGPLAEGLLDGNSVRCPWHHACFDLDTGRPLRAPALNGLPTFEVEERDGRIFVGQQVERPYVPPAPRATPASVVIVGGGAAGDSCAAALRVEGYTGPITMLSDDADVPVDRPNLSKDFLAGSAEESWMPLRGEDFYAENNIELRLQTRVARVIPEEHRVELEGGEHLEYGALLLATGAEPVVLPIDGAGEAGVRYLRTWADARAIVEAAQPSSVAVVVGASFIGTEVAASLAQRGLTVHVVAPDQLPLVKVLGPELASAVKALHEEHGVAFHLGRSVERFEAGAAILDDGQRLEADLIVAGVGVRARTQLAEAAGLEVDRGVVVDEFLRSSAPDVWAAGDIARWPDPLTGERLRIEHWVVAQRQGRTAALNMLGHEVAFDLVPFFWSQQYDVTINYVGHAAGWQGLEVMGSVEGHDCLVAYRTERGVTAVASIFRDRASLEAEQAMERGEPRYVEEWLEAQRSSAG